MSIVIHPSYHFLVLFIRVLCYVRARTILLAALHPRLPHSLSLLELRSGDNPPPRRNLQENDGLVALRQAEPRRRKRDGQITAPPVAHLGQFLDYIPVLELQPLVNAFLDLNRLRPGIVDHQYDVVHLSLVRLIPVRIDPRVRIVDIEVHLPSQTRIRLPRARHNIGNVLAPTCAGCVRDPVPHHHGRVQVVPPPGAGVRALAGVPAGVSKRVSPAEVVEEGDVVREEEHIGLGDASEDGRNGGGAGLAPLALEELDDGERLEWEKAGRRVLVVCMRVRVETDGADEWGWLLAAEEFIEKSGHLGGCVGGGGGGGARGRISSRPSCRDGAVVVG